ncbi:MAG: hypothetical protein IT265_16050 [Saprospiraceae bacterium]|nr:hypothetical protein [Saprospiraceae bacterium]
MKILKFPAVIVLIFTLFINCGNERATPKVNKVLDKTQIMISRLVSFIPNSEYRDTIISELSKKNGKELLVVYNRYGHWSDELIFIMDVDSLVSFLSVSRKYYNLQKLNENFPDYPEEGVFYNGHILKKTKDTLQKIIESQKPYIDSANFWIPIPYKLLSFYSISNQQIKAWYCNTYDVDLIKSIHSALKIPPRIGDFYQPRFD